MLRFPAPATNGINHIDNVEQVFLANPGEYSLIFKITHSGTLTGGSQAFSIIVSGITTASDIFPPKNLIYNINESSILLNWSSPVSGTPVSYKIYRNGQLIAETSETFYNDPSIILNNIYEYYITAVYIYNNDQIESVGTNQVTVFPQTLRSLPFIVDFEIEPTEVIIKNNQAGWQWGDSESLNCYYLDFSDNTTKFIGIDSYSVGDAVHVADVATTAPLRLAEYSNVVLTFDYLLKTGIYGAIDELHVVYKLQEETEWHELENLESSFDWKFESIELPEEICKNGTQIGFYYDDFYQWGMGAGLDNIQIVGTATRSIDLAMNSLVSPASDCLLSEDEPILITIKNVGNQVALVGDRVNIQMNVSSGENVNDILVLTENLNIGESLIHQMSSVVDLSDIGTYTFDFNITCSLDNNTSNNSLSTDIDVYGYPQVHILNEDLTFCESDPQILIQVTPTGGTLAGPGVSGLYFNPVLAGEGNHTIIYTFIGPGGCESADQITFTVNALPNVSAGSDQSICEGNTVTLSGSGASSYVWDNGVVDRIAFTSPLGTTTYTVTGTDTNGCQDTDQVSVTVNALPSVSAGPDLSVCEGSTVTLSGSGAVTYVWNNGITNGVSFIPPPGTTIYTLTGTDANGCQDTDQVSVTVNALPNVSAGPDLSICEGSTVTL